MRLNMRLVKVFFEARVPLYYEGKWLPFDKLRGVRK